MKRFTLLGLSLALLLFGSSTIAETHRLQILAMPYHLASMTDKPLAYAVAFSDYRIACGDAVSIFQVNINISGYTKQTNNAIVI